MRNKTLGIFTLLAVGCYAGIDTDDVESRDFDDTTLEIVENLEIAGFPEHEIGILADGTVFVGMDAVVSLEASRELAGIVGEPGTNDFRQYRTTNLVDASIGNICVDGSDFESTQNLSIGLDNAIANYNGQNLSFVMTRTSGNNAGCDAVIIADRVGGGGGSAGFPSGGLPYWEINIGNTIASYGVAVATHVITHELGHCVGFRHTDYFNRSISCGGQASNEGSGGVGAIHIPGTPTGAVEDGSVMNSCFHLGSTGVWTSSDEDALAALYGGGGGGGGGGPVCGDGSCSGGESCGSCESDCGACPACAPKGASCTSDSDCCGNKCKGGGSKTCK